MAWREWVRTVEVEPSLYAANFANLGAQITPLLNAGARVFHFDIGDGHFVEPITIGPVVLKSIAPLVHDAGGVLDCHLMVEEPEKHIRQVAAAGGDSVTFHVEACDDVPAVLEVARGHGLEVGVAFNPETDVDEAVEAAADADLALCMSIHPGYSGQAFMPETYDRVRRLRELIPPEMHVQVDGGVGIANIEQLREVGVDLFVAGSSIFAADDIAVAYRSLVRTHR